MFIYDRKRGFLEIWEPSRIYTHIKAGVRIGTGRITVTDLSKAQDKWVGLQVLEGHTPSIDFGYDQLIIEMKIAEEFKREPEAFPRAASFLFERFKTSLNPPIDEQRKRLHRMAAFLNEMALVDLNEDYVILDPDNRILKGRAVYARAVSDGETEVNYIKLEEMPYPDKSVELNVWDDFEVLNTLAFD